MNTHGLSSPRDNDIMKRHGSQAIYCFIGAVLSLVLGVVAIGLLRDVAGLYNLVLVGVIACFTAGALVFCGLLQNREERVLSRIDDEETEVEQLADQLFDRSDSKQADEKSAGAADSVPLA